VAQVYWYEGGRGRLEDLRASCPVRTDIDPMLRCVVLAEAAVVLQRRPHADAYIGIAYAPRGVAEQAARLLDKFGVPPVARDLLADLTAQAASLPSRRTVDAHPGRPRSRPPDAGPCPGHRAVQAGIVAGH
jgi:hypothetical protein